MGLLENIAAYEKMRDTLETESNGKWVLIHDEKFVDSFDSFEAAARVAVKKFGRGPYLIRRVGVSSASLPASVLYGIT